MWYNEECRFHTQEKCVILVYCSNLALVCVQILYMAVGKLSLLKWQNCIFLHMQVGQLLLSLFSLYH